MLVYIRKVQGFVVYRLLTCWSSFSKKKKKKRVAGVAAVRVRWQKIEITHVQGLALVLSMSMEKTLFYTTNCECSSLGVSMAKLWK